MNTYFKDDFEIRTYIEKSNIDFKDGETHEQVCTAMTNGPDLDIEWYNKYGQLLRTNRVFRVITLTKSPEPLTKTSALLMTNLQLEHSGVYTCKATAGRKQDSVSFELVAIENKQGKQTDLETRGGQPFFCSTKNSKMLI